MYYMHYVFNAITTGPWRTLLSFVVRCILQQKLIWKSQNISRSQMRYMCGKMQQVVIQVIFWKLKFHCLYTCGIIGHERIQNSCQFHYSLQLYCCTVQCVCMPPVPSSHAVWCTHCVFPAIAHLNQCDFSH